MIRTKILKSVVFLARFRFRNFLSLLNGHSQTPSPLNGQIPLRITDTVYRCSLTLFDSGMHIWSSEIYPTAFRSSGIGFLDFWQHIGAAASPWIAKGLTSVSREALFFGILLSF